MEEAVLLEVVKVGVPLLIELLEKYGQSPAAEAFKQKTESEIVEDIKSLQTYQQYPTGKNGQTENG